MTRLLSRIAHRRAERDEEHPAPPRDAQPPADQPTTVLRDGAVAEPGPVPAATDPDAPAAPSFRDRGRLRRRLRYLRRVRELGFRDLGGLVFDQHRFDRRDPALVEAKVRALDAVDRELRAVERTLHAQRPVTELREAGLSTCARCGALMSSDARFCSACGAPARGARELTTPGPADVPATPAEPAQPTDALRTAPAGDGEPPRERPATVAPPADRA